MMCPDWQIGLSQRAVNGCAFNHHAFLVQSHRFVDGSLYHPAVDAYRTRLYLTLPDAQFFFYYRNHRGIRRSGSSRWRV